MKPLAISCALALGIALVVAAPSAFARAATQAEAAASAPTAAPAAPKLHSTLRGLLHGHVVATRNYALAVYAGNEQATRMAAHDVVDNAKRLANAVAGFYGQAAGDAFLKLLEGHWAGVQALTDAAYAQYAASEARGGPPQVTDSAAEQQAMQSLVANGNDIARFLSGANPNLSEDGVKSLWLQHVNDHKMQVDELMSNAPRAEQIKTWTHMQDHANAIADALASAIAIQFPDKAK